MLTRARQVAAALEGPQHPAAAPGPLRESRLQVEEAGLGKAQQRAAPPTLRLQVAEAVAVAGRGLRAVGVWSRLLGFAGPLACATGPAFYPALDPALGPAV